MKDLLSSRVTMVVLGGLLYIGVTMLCLYNSIDTFKPAQKVETIDPEGETFDPQKHEAMTMLPSAEHDENTVLTVLEKGYQLHDRLIRPAKVVVSRKP